MIQNRAADDLLGLFVYIILNAKVEKLWSEAHFMEDFIPERSSKNEEGYLLVTFQAALVYD